MSEDIEEQVALNQNQMDDGYRIHPPNKKKYEDEIDKLMTQIRGRETELDKVKTSGGLNITGELKNLKVEKNTTIAKRKQIDVELEKVKKIIPEKMHQLGQLESSLIYKSEDKINGAIQRLEWNLKVQPFKLMEEKKIVSEIDRLKRSKKTLVQYLALKQEISTIRDMQRIMREDRDTYFQVVGKINSEEEKIRRDSNSAKSTFSVLKSEIDELYENKRQLVTNYKKQMEEYQGAREKYRKGSWKKREDYRKSAIIERKKHQQVELEVEKTPFEKYISWCNSLIRVLSRYSSLAAQEPSLDSISPASSVEEPELAEEIDDGQYILLKKNGEGLEHTLGARRPSKKNRRPRKQSSMKKVTLSPDMLQQLTELGLRPPNSTAEVAEAIECLKAKKVHLEQEQQTSEVASDAGISATESLICEMSRQASKTESYEGAVDTNPGEHVYAEILHGSPDKQSDHPEGWEVEGAVGGCEEHSGILSPNSDSTVDGDTGSSESQSSVCRHPESSSSHDISNPVVIVFPAEEHEDAIENIPLEKSKSLHGMMKSDDAQKNQKKMVVFPEEQQGKIVLSNVDGTYPYGDKSLECVDCLCRSRSDGHTQSTDVSGRGIKPNLLCVSPLLVKQQPSQSLDFPSLVTTSTAVSLSQSGNSSVWNSSTEAVRSTNQVSNFTPALSPNQSHCTFVTKLSSPPSTVGRMKQVQPAATSVSTSQSHVALFCDEEFPSLSQSMSQPRRGSNLSTKSSGGSSAHQEQPLQSCDQHPSTPTSNQITSSDICVQSNAQMVFPTQQSPQQQTSPTNEDLQDSYLTAQKRIRSNSHSDTLLCMSQISTLDKSSTEKWVESSVAFVKDFIPDQCEDNVTANLTESTKL